MFSMSLPISLLHTLRSFLVNYVNILYHRVVLIKHYPSVGRLKYIINHLLSIWPNRINLWLIFLYQILLKGCLDLITKERSIFSIFIAFLLSKPLMIVNVCTYLYSCCNAIYIMVSLLVILIFVGSFIQEYLSQPTVGREASQPNCLGTQILRTSFIGSSEANIDSLSVCSHCEDRGCTSQLRWRC